MLNSGVGNGVSVSQQQLQQLQQHSSQQQQQQQSQHTQLQQSQSQQVKQKIDLQHYHFTSTSEEILKKYARNPASLILHIFETHYRFNNSQDSQIIPKDSPMIKDFMHHVLKEEIPVEMSELLKDFSIKSYDGCLILQVYDHRHMVKTTVTQPRPANASKDTKPVTTIVSKPKTYRTLLKPTPLSIYYDLLYHTDSALTKFTDTLSLQMESEILTLTNRKLDLSVPLNPYACDDYLKPESESTHIEYDEVLDDNKVAFNHRSASSYPARKIHQDELVLHKSSEYEEIMLLLSNRHKRSDEPQDKKLVMVHSSTLPIATAAPVVTNSGKQGSKEASAGVDGKGKKSDKSNIASSAPIPSTLSSTQNTSRSTGQFMRLRLIEEIRKKREAEKLQQEAKIQAQASAVQQTDSIAAAAAAAAAAPVPTPMSAPMGAPESQQVKQPQAPGPQPAAKRVKKEPTKKQLAAQAQAQAKSQQAQAQASLQSPQFNGGMASSTSTSQVQSSSSTPSMRNNQPPPTPVPQQQQQQQQQHQQQMGAPSQGQGQMSLLQQQQQQLFHNSLTPEEQQMFKQMQQKAQAFAIMGNTGITPNRQQLTPQQKQQALQQSKNIQQQLVEKFPVYFQRLRELHAIQQQRQQKQKLQQQRQQQQAQAVAAAAGTNPVDQQHTNIAGKTVPGSASVVPEPKKKRQYRKKNANPTT
ncbi:uncharacterized protein SPAPADRAFT_69613 [Spathaspora passalidarum NRRL Y-27907]|uniref:Spt20-like SEP domain-containing protein n=1 Tax=Spathaspora passalidarum (strain NRRL Y-27907 / 11-Y1) TaxID=619300 RepID=G3AGK7_SPAPN|nr:uncharacterized protein SPAPADRAFT_69613 [Spathaspora passalidarum NRRL Y-27907]EGW35346.1 hypothetical protein SPAPADRAFT_69613 [Spathaspora passalidarum NRRL Y-27907]